MLDGDSEGDVDGLLDGDELGLLVGSSDGDEEGVADGDDEGVVVGLADGTEDFNTHSRLPTKSSSFTDLQHSAMSQTPIRFEFVEHSEMNSRHIAS